MSLSAEFTYDCADVSYREFAESTILTIAHRLRTIIDYDRVRIKQTGLCKAQH